MNIFYKAYPLDAGVSKKREQQQELFKLDVITNFDAQCDNSRSSGCALKWNLERQYFLNGFNDGEYEVRAKTFCSGYDAFATFDVRGSVTDENLRLFVDVTSPTATQTSSLNRALRIDYSEKTACPQLSKSSMTYEIKRIKTCDGTAIDNGRVSDEHVYFNYIFKCTSDPPYSLIIEFPEDSLTPDGTYEVTVNANINRESDKVSDIGGNPVKRQTFLTTLGEHCVADAAASRASSARASTTAIELGLDRSENISAAPLGGRRRTTTNALLVTLLSVLLFFLRMIVFALALRKSASKTFDDAPDSSRAPLLINERIADENRNSAEEELSKTYGTVL